MSIPGIDEPYDISYGMCRFIHYYPVNSCQQLKTEWSFKTINQCCNPIDPETGLRSMLPQELFRFFFCSRDQLQLLIGSISSVGISGNEVSFNPMQDMSQVIRIRAIWPLYIV